MFFHGLVNWCGFKVLFFVIAGVSGVFFFFTFKNLIHAVFTVDAVNQIAYIHTNGSIGTATVGAVGIGAVGVIAFHNGRI